ncbi:alpha/beta fold hydrolase [Streptomyces sp. NPDC097619]|uniref:alpha/beta fold hydrolase n=1 Tax=Streptomyces sp. NPDC097619 TaxID=3157228 RepID=UPI0033279318
MVLLTGPRAPRTPAAAVLLLHGGREHGVEPPPSVLNLPGLRMRPFERAVRRATAGRDVLLARVRYRHRGWNGRRADAAEDALRALEELRDSLGPVPVVLVGHSMGGRAALRAAGAPGVRGVVALAPWCPPEEPVEHLRGRRIIALHDPVDRVTHATDTWAFLDRARAVGAETTALRMDRGGHAMLRGAGDWHRLAAGAVTELLALPSPADTTAAPAPGGP